MQFVDTNIFIRFLTKDDPKKAGKCLSLFQKAEKGKLNLQTTESIVAEIVYILESKRLYNLTHIEIYSRLLPILRIKGLKIPYKNTLILGLEIYSKNNIDFEDAILIAFTLNTDTTDIYSYDKGFDKMPGINRLEPSS